LIVRQTDARTAHPRLVGGEPGRQEPGCSAAARGEPPKRGFFFVNLNLRRNIGATFVALLLGATIAACSAGGDTAGGTTTETSASQGGSVSTEHNDSDTQFAQMMIVHHQGALEMAELAADNAESPEVKELAERISAAQQPEIDTMTGWLDAWGEDTGMSGMDHSGHAGMDMNGMTQEDVMGHLESLEGAEFDAFFVEHMIAHHQGAIEMAEAELEGGINSEAKALAQTIIDDQTAEIAEMEQLAESAGQ
jgi:uncharacterized protein (DUF305 family)